MSNRENLNQIENFLNTTLDIQNVPDYSAALNGLQLENNGTVTKVAAAVDASLPVIEKAIARGADLLLVHHGMFWHGTQRLVDAKFKKLKMAMDANLAIYSAHIPLDVHLEYGNNVILANKIGMNLPAQFHDWKGIQLGLKQKLDCDFSELLERVKEAVGSEVHYCNGRSEPNVGIVGVITGGAGSEIQSMADQGIDTFITGEGPHWSYPLAEELGVNIIYAGHYATETFGVKKISEVLSQQFALDSLFIDHPTGL